MKPRIAVFRGGVSREREISMGSGAAALAALSRRHDVVDCVIEERKLPTCIDSSDTIVFSTLHGTFGEDGGMQALLEAAGFDYAGCDAAASALTFDKQATKQRVAAAGVAVPDGIAFHSSNPPAAPDLVARLGNELVFKPRAEGSSVGLRLASGHQAVQQILAELETGNWLCESRVRGRELTVGLLGTRALAIVEIRPKSGTYDFTSKYSKGLTEFECPANLPDSVTEAVCTAAERAFKACGCRDFARVDFILPDDGVPRLLEINTLPGLKETSLLPMSAIPMGHDFESLVEAMLAPALQRHLSRKSNPS
jgi:D-alanine-D-alanine ligase